MWPLLPAITSGVPGSVTPVTSIAASPGAARMSRARYHTFGTRSARCMSLATIAPPLAVRLPATAQLLLPTAGRVRAWRAGGSKSRPPRLCRS